MTALSLVLIGGLATSACFKSLDESLLDATAGSAGAGNSGGTGATGAMGGSAGSSGSAGNGGADAGLDAATDADTDADVDAGVVISVTPWDVANFPATSLTGGASNALISVDGIHLYFVQESALDQTVSRRSLSTPGNEVVGTAVDGASALLAPPGNLFLYVGVGIAATDDGKLIRLEKQPGGLPVDVPHSSKIGRIAAMTVLESSTNPRLFVVAKTSTAGQPHVLTATLAGGATTLDLVYTDPDGNQTGGPIAVDKNCVYWLSNGKTFAVPLAGGTRVAALSAPVTDATGLASDGTNFYVARANGEVWQRRGFGSTCDASSPAEKRVLEGFSGAKELVSYADRIAFISSDSPLGEGGVYSHAIGSSTVEQVAPASETAQRLQHAGTALVYSTAAGTIKQTADGR